MPHSDNSSPLNLRSLYLCSLIVDKYTFTALHLVPQAFSCLSHPCYLLILHFILARMAPFKGTWFTVLKEWHPTADDQKLSCCTIRPGEAGWVLDTNPNGWTLIKLNELKFGWVPSARLKTTEYVRDLPVKVIFEVKAIQPQGPTTSTAQSFRFAKALDDLSNWMKSSSSLDFLNQEAQNILVADSQLFNLKTSLLNGIPSRLASILNQAQYTIADLLTCEQVEPQSGSGLYARIYELAGGEYHIYIGSR